MFEILSALPLEIDMMGNSTVFSSGFSKYVDKIRLHLDSGKFKGK